MGRVYRAIDELTEDVVAVKIVEVNDSIDSGRFDREASSLARLTHPTIVRYIAHGVTDQGAHFLVQEWIDGVRLSDRLSREGLSVRESVAAVAQVAAALATAHGLGIVHRDLKPSNLLLEDNDCARVRVLDFGIARVVDSEHRLTRTGTAVGTPGYMSPEQATGSITIDARADVFGLGCVLYYCLAGLPAFPGSNATSVRTKLLLCEPPLLGPRCPEAPQALVNLVTRMLEKARGRRPRDAAAVLAELTAIELPESCDTRRVHALSAATQPLMERSARSTSAADISGNDFVSIVFVRDTTGQGETRIDEARIEELQTALAMLKGDLDVLGDDSLVLRLQGEPLATATRAARAALILATALPAAGVSISSGSLRALTEVIEEGTQSLERAVIERLFIDDAAPHIHLDALTAELVRDRFSVETDERRAIVMRGRLGEGETC